MAKYSYTWAVEEQVNGVWRVKAMDTEISPLDGLDYVEAKTAELREQGWQLSEGQRLTVSYWGVYKKPRAV